ncbi:hypothetical protein B296_00006995 [Ensete ventricosum]|uniref:Uncharacterized protein n=1 Tax=Ensete ventricosum TaxID=4639 RepID=A0A426ZL39_ENSVE|nr:hypothetical protein B296_00006995 [Ensete ventricosum]
MTTDLITYKREKTLQNLPRWFLLSPSSQIQLRSQAGDGRASVADIKGKSVCRGGRDSVLLFGSTTRNDVFPAQYGTRLGEGPPSRRKLESGSAQKPAKRADDEWILELVHVLGPKSRMSRDSQNPARLGQGVGRVTPRELSRTPS